MLPSQPLTSPMSLCLDDLTDATGSDAVLGGKLDLVPGSTAQVVQFEGSITGADKNIFPLLCVVYRVLKHKTCTDTDAQFRFSAQTK